MDIKIILAEDHTITREGVQNMLHQHAGMKVVGQARNGREAVELAAKINPDVIVMDVMLPELNGVEATRKITTANKKTKVVALSMYSDKRFVRRMFQAGASAYILKDSAFDELVNGIHSVIRGRAYLSPEIAKVVIAEISTRETPDDAYRYSVLTPREREVLQLIAEGLSTRKIANKLCVSIKTVETHRRQIMLKLHAPSVAHLTKYAIAEGITSLSL